MKEQKPWVKPVLEMGPLLVFFAVFMLYRGRSVTLMGQDYSGFVLATLVFVPVLVLATLIQWRLMGRLGPMQLATLVMVVVLGGLSVWLNDPQFFKMKPTLIYLLFAAVLAYSLLRRKQWVKAVMSEALQMDDAGWRKLTVRMMVLFLALAIVNEVVWRNMSETSWVWFKTFGIIAILFVFLLGNAGLYRAHGIDKPQDETPE